VLPGHPGHDRHAGDREPDPDDREDARRAVEREPEHDRDDRHKDPGDRRHDAHREDPSYAFARSRLSSSPDGPTPIGVFRDVQRPVYGDLMTQQIAGATDRSGPGDLEKLLHSGDTWDVR
jgi:hypothetical protein